MVRRKTCPTNRGLRPMPDGLPHRLSWSEDLPHKSGITTVKPDSVVNSFRRKTCPTNRGLRPLYTTGYRQVLQSEDLPHKSGITTLYDISFSFLSLSEDLPHKSGITTPPLKRLRMRNQVGRLAPQIGDYDEQAVAVLTDHLVGRLAPQIGDYDKSS